MAAKIKPTSAAPPAVQPILFYDGNCGFCNNSICFVLRHEHTAILHFAPFQGETAAQVLGSSGLPPDIGDHTIVLMENGEFSVRASAGFGVMARMGGIWKTLASIFRLIPLPLSDAVYRWVARNRGRLPGGRSCQLPDPNQRQRFLP